MTTGRNIIKTLNPQLTYFLQYSLRWNNLNEIQLKAIPSISKGKDTLIIAPTASGKTEAALIPVYNEIITNQYKATSVLYIAPLRALINDMKERIDTWNRHFNLTATKWHGDVNRGIKDNYIKNPTDILLITPESLEVILINKTKKEKEKIFNNVKYIIIDEIHYFYDSERGIQLNSLLTRLSKYMDNTTTIGLSATVKNPKQVAKWINPKENTKIIKTKNEQENKYKIIRYENEEEIPQQLEKYTKGKILIFAKSRREVEEYYYILKEKIHTDNIYIHHGSLDRSTREKNEEKFKKAKHAIMISTTTLELGIDIGDIDLVVQIGPTNNVSSLLQRIGRGRRRINIKRTIIFVKNITEAIQTVALLNLIDKEKLEDIQPRQKAKDIYLHQILSIILEYNEIKIPELYYMLHETYVFNKITKNEYRKIIEHLINIKLVEINHKNRLIIGDNFEEEFRKHNLIEFYTVFTTTKQYTIKQGRKTIGQLDPAYTNTFIKGSTFILGGNHWQITKIDRIKQVIHVKKGRKTNNIPVWSSKTAMINYTITHEIHKILLNKTKTTNLKLLDEEYIKWIKNITQKLKNQKIKQKDIPVVIKQTKNYNKTSIYTFAGSKENYLLANLIKQEQEIYNLEINPTHITYKTKEENNIITVLNNIQDNISNEKDKYMKNTVKKNINTKYMKYLPETIQEEVKTELLFNYETLEKVLKNKTFKILPSFNIEPINM